MKKELFIVLLLICTTNLFGRNKSDMGVFFGLNLANIEGDWHNNSEQKTGATAGLYFSIKLSDNFSLRPELYYTSKGSENKFPIEVDPNENKYKEKYSYIEMPILISYALVDQRRFKIQLVGGPVISYLVEAKWEFIVSGIQASEQDIDETTQKFDYGALIGTNFNFEMYGQTLLLGFRYIHGLHTVNDSKEQLDMKNRVMSVIAGFSF